MEVLTCLARGLSIKAVATRLALTSKTVQTHRNNLRKKLGVTTDVELCLLAIKAGLLDLHRTEIGRR
jgi:DNA-binding NarL/FixJ family response regulator